MIERMVKLHVNNMLLNVDTLCIWSIPQNNVEYVNNGPSLSFSVFLCAPLTTSTLSPSASLRCLKHPNEYR